MADPMQFDQFKGVMLSTRPVAIKPVSPSRSAGSGATFVPVGNGYKNDTGLCPAVEHREKRQEHRDVVGQLRQRKHGGSGASAFAKHRKWLQGLNDLQRELADQELVAFQEAEDRKRRFMEAQAAARDRFRKSQSQATATTTNDDDDDAENQRIDANGEPLLPSEDASVDDVLKRERRRRNRKEKKARRKNRKEKPVWAMTQDEIEGQQQLSSEIRPGEDNGAEERQDENRQRSFSMARMPPSTATATATATATTVSEGDPLLLADLEDMDLEMLELMEFVDALDFDKFMDDISITSKIETIDERILQLERATATATATAGAATTSARQAQAEPPAAATLVDGRRMRPTAGTSSELDKLKRQKMLLMYILRKRETGGRLPRKGRESESAADEEEQQTDDSESRLASAVLSASSTARKVHSKSSMRRVVGFASSATSDDGGVPAATLPAPVNPVIAKHDPHAITSDAVDRRKLIEVRKEQPSLLPYLHRHPGV